MTERDKVAYTATTLNAIADCISYMESKLKRGTLDSGTEPTLAQAQEEVIAAKQKLCELEFGWTRKFARASSVASTYVYALPDDYNRYINFRDVTNDLTPRYVDPNTFDILWPDISAEGSDTPEAFTIKDRELWIYPPTAAAYTLELEYKRNGDDSTPTDISYIPQNFRWIMCNSALSECFEIIHQWEAAGYYASKADKALSKALALDRRKKWARTSHEKLSWEQERIGDIRRPIQDYP